MTSKTVSLPPPVGGLNARDAISDMPREDAIELTNWVCEPDYVRIRRGYSSWATGVTGGVESLMSWEGPTSRKLFAASSDTIYDVSAGGTASSAVTGLTGGDWLTTMFANAGGNYLWIANGADAPYHYNGTVWQQPTLTGIASPATLVHPFVHKRRIWAIEKDTLSTWYLETDAIAGAMTEFDFGSIMTEGGYLMAAGSISRDGGDGPDDYACFVSSQGQIAIYAGTDPAAASTWSLVGVYDIQPPIGRRCLKKLGGDLGIITEGGIVPVSQMVQLERSQSDVVSITSKINRSFNTDALLRKDEPGWQIVTKPRANLMIVNVPTGNTVSGVNYIDEGGETYVDENGEAYGEVGSVSTFKQYVMNTLTGAWSDYDGQNGKRWVLHNQELYFGDTGGTVYKADTGYQDAGDIITADMKTAFSHFGDRGRTKAFSMIKPFIDASGVPGTLLDINTDYEDREPATTPTAIATAGATWGAATWGESTWPAVEVNIASDWQGVDGEGVVAAVRMRVTTNGGEVRLYGFDTLVEQGGIL